MKIIYLLLIAGCSFALYVYMSTRKGMKACKKSEARYRELIEKGLNDDEAFLLISKELYPQYSDEVHLAVANKCRDIYELGNFLGATFENPRPTSDDMALDLINSATISESGFPVWKN